jgi:hypothetical protein
MYHPHHQGENNQQVKTNISSNCKETVFLCTVLQLLVTPDVVAGLLIFFTLMMEVMHSSETSVLTRAIWPHIQEYGILLTDIIKLKFWN